MYTVKCLQFSMMQKVYMEDLAATFAVEILRKVQDVEVPSNPDRVLNQHPGSKPKFVNIFDLLSSYMLYVQYSVYHQTCMYHYKH